MIVESGDSWSALLLPLLIIVGIGALGIVGWLVWIFTRGSRSKGQPADVATVPPRPERSNPVSPEPATGPNVSSAPAVSAAALTYFLGLRRSTDTGEWEVHVQGQRYALLEDVPNQQIQAQVVSALRALVDFSRGYVQKQKSPARASSGVPSSSSAGSAARSPSPPRPSDGGAPAETPRRGSASASAMPSIDLAQEIGDIVEEMLAQEPSLEGHAVRLMNDPTGGINFLVDGVVYRDLSDIPNRDIQLLIRRATREWERR